METGKAVALAGITATAIVGVAGATSSWLIARDDRANQRALAHEARVYDRRAGAYLAALGVIQRQRDQIHHDLMSTIDALNRGAVFRPPKTYRMATDADPLVPRLTAFGSPHVVAAYQRMGLYVGDMHGLLLDDWQRLRRPHLKRLDREDIQAALVDGLSYRLDRFDQRQQQFERLIHSELA
jgi:hypothetical protein